MHEIERALGGVDWGAGPAGPLIAAIARDNEGWTRWVAMEILIDCLAWVRPEQHFVDADGDRRTVRGALCGSVRSLRSLLQTLAADSTSGDLNGSTAAELLKTLEENNAE